MNKIPVWLVACCLATACAARAPSTPAIWKVSDADNSVYLLGSFHALKPDDYPLSHHVQAAYADAERLAFEITPQELQSPELPMQMQQAARLPSGQDLQALISEASWQRLQAWSRANPAFSMAYLNRFEPWYVAIVVANSHAQAKGFEPELGVDQHFMNAAKSSVAVRKPTLGLEQASQQIALFDGLSPKAQQQLLEETLDGDTEHSAHDLEMLRRLWKRGDVPGLQHETIDRMRRDYPDLYQSVNVARNHAWLPQIQAMLDEQDSDDTLVVVGALHLLGEDGLVQLLQAKGYRVERLQ